MSKSDRMKNGDQNFKKYVIQALREEFPGVWQSTSGTMMDYKGIDFLYTDKSQNICWSIAARVWNSYPKQHFSARWKRESDPNLKLEAQSRIEELKTLGHVHTHWTLEAFFWESWVYIAQVDSQLLWETYRRNEDDLTIFPCQNSSDRVFFKRIPWDMLPNGAVKTYTKPRP
jgi:hypothetical protein